MTPSQVFNNILHLQNYIRTANISTSIDLALKEIDSHLIKHNITTVIDAFLAG